MAPLCFCKLLLASALCVRDGDCRCQMRRPPTDLYMPSAPLTQPQNDTKTVLQITKQFLEAQGLLQRTLPACRNAAYYLLRSTVFRENNKSPAARKSSRPKSLFLNTEIQNPPHQRRLLRDKSTKLSRYLSVLPCNMEV